MRCKLFITVAIAMGVVACRHDGFTRGSGDASSFVLKTAVALGGRPNATNALANLGREWRFLKDEYGVLVRLPETQFDATDAYLRSLFGMPESSAGWAARDVGVAIILQRVDGETQVGFLRQMAPEALDKALHELNEELRRKAR